MYEHDAVVIAGLIASAPVLLLAAGLSFDAERRLTRTRRRANRRVPTRALWLDLLAVVTLLAALLATVLGLSNLALLVYRLHAPAAFAVLASIAVALAWRLATVSRRGRAVPAADSAQPGQRHSSNHGARVSTRSAIPTPPVVTGGTSGSEPRALVRVVALPFVRDLTEAVVPPHEPVKLPPAPPMIERQLSSSYRLLRRISDVPPPAEPPAGATLPQPARRRWPGRRWHALAVLTCLLLALGVTLLFWPGALVSQLASRAQERLAANLREAVGAPAYAARTEGSGPDIGTPTPVEGSAGEPLPTAHVTAQRLNLRVRPGADQPVLLELARGARVSLLGEQQMVAGGVWVRVQVDGLTGWVNRGYLD